MRVRSVNPGRRASTRHRARRREASARRDHAQLDLVHFEFDESHAWTALAKEGTRSCAVQFSSPRKASAPKGESVPIPGTQTVQQADLGNKIESSESSLVLRYKGRRANELAPSMTVILQSPSAPFARRWTEQPRPRGARDVRVALESRPASVAPREVPRRRLKTTACACAG